VCIITEGRGAVCMCGASDMAPGSDEWCCMWCPYVSCRKLSCSATSLFGNKEKLFLSTPWTRVGTVEV